MGKPRCILDGDLARAVECERVNSAVTDMAGTVWLYLVQCASVGRLTASHFLRDRRELLHALAMADDEQADKSLFFAGSGDEEDDVLDYVTPPHAGPSSENLQVPTQPPSHPQPTSLFFADSGDEDEPIQTAQISPAESIRDPSIGIVDGVEKMEVDVEASEAQPGRASSVSSASSAPLPVPSSPASSVGPETAREPSKKKRKLSPETEGNNTFEPAYIGSFLVGNAWSTVRGKGFIKVSNNPHHFLLADIV